MCDFAHFNSSGRDGMVGARSLPVPPKPTQAAARSPGGGFFFGARFMAGCRDTLNKENAPAPMVREALRDRSQAAGRAAWLGFTVRQTSEWPRPSRSADRRRAY